MAKTLPTDGIRSIKGKHSYDPGPGIQTQWVHQRNFEVFHANLLIAGVKLSDRNIKESKVVPKLLVLGMFTHPTFHRESLRFFSWVSKPLLAG